MVFENVSHLLRFKERLNLDFLRLPSNGTDSTNKRPVFTSVSEMEPALDFLEKAKAEIKIDNYNKKHFQPGAGFLFLYILEPRNVTCSKDTPHLIC